MRGVYKLNSQGQLVPPRSVDYMSTSEIVKSWNPGCNRDNEITTSLHTVKRQSTPSDDRWWPWSKAIVYVRNRKRKPYPFSPCINVKKRLSSDATSLTFTYYHENVDDRSGETYDCGDGDWETRTTYARESLTIGLGAVLDAPFVESGIALSDDWAGSYHDNPDLEAKIFLLEQQAFGDMVPKLDTGFSMPLFLAELIELKSLVRNMGWLASALTGDAKRRLRNFLDAMGGDSHKPGEYISGHVLATQFGVLPLVRDIRTIAEKFATAGPKVLQFVEGSKQPSHTLYWQHALSPDSFKNPSEHPLWWESQEYLQSARALANGIDGLNTNDIPEINFRYRVRQEVVAATYHATMRFSYSIPKHSAAVTSFLAELDHWGIQFSTKDVWNAVPFSFLVDWVFSVSDWLEKFDSENLPVQVRIDDFCSSLKYRRITKVQITHITEPNWAIPLSPSVEQVTDVYYRWVGHPNPSEGQTVGWKTPRGYHLVMGSALLTSRSRQIEKLLGKIF